MKLHNLKQTIRFFLKDKTYFIINTIGFSIALTIVLLVTSWVIYENSFDNFHQKRKNIYRIVEKTYFPGEEISYSSSIPEWMVNVFEKEIPEIEASTSLSWLPILLPQKMRKILRLTMLCMPIIKYLIF